MALYKNYTIYAGTAFCEPIDLVDSAPINFNNYEVKARMAESGYSESYISINTEVTHYTQGKLQLSLSADETSVLAATVFSECIYANK
jgi:hypothetical protein